MDNKFKLGQEVFYVEGEEVHKLTVKMIGLEEKGKTVAYRGGNDYWIAEKNLMTSESEAKSIALKAMKKRHAKEIEKLS